MGILLGELSVDFGGLSSAFWNPSISKYDLLSTFQKQLQIPFWQLRSLQTFF